MTARNPAIEIYRVGAMFGIVLLHAIVQGGYLRGRGLDNVLLSCVTAFVFISGYFGIRFSAQKAFKLIALGCYCSLVAALFGKAPGMVMDIVKYHWFLWAYLVLMCFAPVLNCAFAGERSQVLARVLPVLLVVFGWSYLGMVPGLKAYVPMVKGFGALTPLTLVGIYMAARLSRLYMDDCPVKRRWLALCAVLAYGVTWIGFGHYNSIASLVLAGSVFYLVREVRVSVRVGTALAFVVPSMFPVYLLHCNEIGYDFLKQLNHFFIEGCHLGLYGSYLLTTVVIFISCLLIDVPRRLVLLGVERIRK